MEGLCDRCGAMLPPPDLDGLQACPSCGRTVRSAPTPTGDGGDPFDVPEDDADPFAATGAADDPFTTTDRPPSPTPPRAGGPPPPGAATGAAWSPPAGGVGTGPPPPRPTGTPTPRAGRGCGLLSLLIVVAVVGVVAWAVLGVTGAIDDALDLAGGSDLTVDGEEALVLSAEPSQPLDVVAVAHHYDRDRGTTVWQLVRFADGEASPVWRGEPLADGISGVRMAADATTVVAAEGDEVVARSLADGTTTWRTGLSDVVPPTCDGCLHLVGDRVVVRSDDGVVHVLAAADGTVAWSRRLADAQGTVHAAGDVVWLVDDGEGGPVVTIASPADGATIATFAPSCVVDGESASTIDLDPEVAQLADGDLLLGYGTWPGCWERRAPDGTLRWQTGHPDLWFSFGVPWTTDGTTLVSTDSAEGLLVVDLATGAQRAVPARPDAELVPLAVGPDVVLALQASTRGTTRWSVVALDLATLAERWALPLGDAVPAVEEASSSTVVSSGDQRVVIRLQGDAVRTLTLDGGDGTVQVGGVALADGAPLPTLDVDLPSTTSGSHSLASLGERGGTLVVSLDGQLVAVDPATGEVTARYGS